MCLTCVGFQSLEVVQGMHQGEQRARAKGQRRSDSMGASREQQLVRPAEAQAARTVGRTDKLERPVGSQAIESPKCPAWAIAPYSVWDRKPLQVSAVRHN